LDGWHLFTVNLYVVKQIYTNGARVDVPVNIQYTADKGLIRVKYNVIGQNSL